MKERRTNRQLKLAAAVALMATSWTQAASTNWTGLGADSLWTNTANWSAGTPTNGTSDITTFGPITNSKFSIAVGSTTNDLRTIQFTAGAAQGYTLTAGAAIKWRGNFIVDSGVIYNQAINSQIDLRGGGTHDVTNNSPSAVLSLGGNVIWVADAATTTVNTQTVRFGGVGTISVANNMQDSSTPTANTRILNIEKQGGGTVRVTSTNNTYTGTTTVGGGWMLVNGSLATATNPVIAQTGGRIGGTGAINRPINLTAGTSSSLGGLVAAGDRSVNNGVGTLTLNSALTLNPAASVSNAPGFEADITSVGADRVNVTGDFVMANTGLGKISLLNPTFFTPSASTVYTLMSWTGNDPSATASQFTLDYGRTGWQGGQVTLNTAGAGGSLTVSGLTSGGTYGAITVITTWTGGQNNDWNNPGNWSGDIPSYGAGSSLYFNSTPATGNLSPQISTIAGYSDPMDINFQAGAGAYNISPNGSAYLNVHGNITMEAGCTNSQTISANTNLKNSTTPHVITNNATSGAALNITAPNLVNATDSGKLALVQFTGTGTINVASAMQDGVGGTRTLAVKKTADNTLRLSGNSTYTGPTTVLGGQLLVNGTLSNVAGQVTVQSGAKLGGTGSINRPVNIMAMGGLTPGDGGVGNLTFGSTLTIYGAYSESNRPNWDVEVDASGADRLTILGDLVMGNTGTVNINLSSLGSFTPAPGGSYTILTWSGTDPAADASQFIVNHLDAAWTGTQVNVNMAGPGGSITLSGWAGSGNQVPEPTALLATSVIGGMMLLRRRCH